MNSRQVNRFLLIFWAAIAFNGIVCTTTYGQSDLGGLALGAALSKLGDDLKEAMNNAREAGRSTAMEGGLQANYVIQNFAAVYDDKMHQTVNQLDERTRGQLGTIEKTVYQLQSGSDVTLKNSLSQLQQVVNTLPFREHQPQLRSVSPTFITPARTSVPVRIDVNGNFEFASRTGFEPTLRINNKIVRPSQITNQALSFMVPSTLFKDIKPMKSADQFGISTAELVVPWSESKWLGLKTARQTEKYRLLIGKLPDVPGSLTIVTQSEIPTSTQSPIVRGDFNQYSNEAGGNVDRQMDYSIAPDPGCQLVANTAEFFVTSQGGKWTRTLIRSDASGAVYRVNTWHPRNPFGDPAGHVDFRLTAMQQCPSTQKQTSVIEWNKAGHQDLRWGEQKTVSLENVTQFKVNFSAFDGHTYELMSPGSGGNLLRVSVAGKGLEIKAANPQTLQWP